MPRVRAVVRGSSNGRVRLMPATIRSGHYGLTAAWREPPVSSRTDPTRLDQSSGYGEDSGRLRGRCYSGSITQRLTAPTLQGRLQGGISRIVGRMKPTANLRAVPRSAINTIPRRCRLRIAECPWSPFRRAEPLARPTLVAYSLDATTTVARTTFCFHGSAARARNQGSHHGGGNDSWMTCFFPAASLTATSAAGCAMPWRNGASASGRWPCAPASTTRRSRSCSPAVACRP